MNLITEDQLQNTLVQACGAARRPVFHPSDSRKQVRGKDGYEMVGDLLTKGYPDLTIGGRKETIWAELKGPRGRLEEEQVEWMDQLPEHRAYVWQPRDLEEALRVIDQGHPHNREGETPCETCWTCSRKEILKRVGTRRKGTKWRENPSGRARGRGGKERNIA